MDKTYQAPQGRLLSTIVIFVFVLGLLYTLFLVFQQFSLNGDVNSINEDIVLLQADISALESEQIEELFVAQKLQDLIEADAILWSKVIKKLQDLTPVTVFFSSYSGSEDGSIQISGLGDTYGSVSDTISSLYSSTDFDDVFVPSVTLGTTSDGQEVVSFSLQVTSTIE